MIARRFLWIALFGAAQLAGCLQNAASGGTQASPDLADDDPGENGPADPVTSPPDLADTVKIDAFMTSGSMDIKPSANTATLRLNETQTFMITISNPSASSGGTATLALADAPAGFTATFNPATVTVGSTPVTTAMTVTAASTMDAATSVAASIQATVNGVMSSVTFGVSVLPELLVSIPVGVATKANTTAFGAASISVKNLAAGVKVTFINNDIINHEIHASGTGGIAHEGGPLDANGGTYDQTITAGFTGAINFRCHIHSGMTGQIMVTN
jgi:plastocyanin